MKKLVAKTKAGIGMTTSALIAEGAEVQHRGVINLVRKMVIKEGVIGVRFALRTFDTPGGKQRQEVAVLTEALAELVVSRMKNTFELRQFRIALSAAFKEVRHATEEIIIPEAVAKVVAESFPVTVMGSYADKMTSQEIAALTGKEHFHIIRDIEEMLEGLRFNAPKTGLVETHTLLSQYKDAKGEMRPMYVLPKDLTLTLVSGYNVVMRKRIIDRWLELEAKVPAPAVPIFVVPTTLSGALRLAADLSDQVERQILTIAAAQPAVNMVERYVGANGSMCISDAAKTLGVKPHAFFQMLSEDKIIFKRDGKWIPFQLHIDMGRFTVKVGEAHGHAYTNTRIEPAGFAWLSEKYGFAASVATV